MPVTLLAGRHVDDHTSGLGQGEHPERHHLIGARHPGHDGFEITATDDIQNGRPVCRQVEAVRSLVADVASSQIDARGRVEDDTEPTRPGDVDHSPRSGSRHPTVDPLDLIARSFVAGEAEDDPIETVVTRGLHAGEQRGGTSLRCRRTRHLVDGGAVRLIVAGGKLDVGAASVLAATSAAGRPRSAGEDPLLAQAETTDNAAAAANNRHRFGRTSPAPTIRPPYDARSEPENDDDAQGTQTCSIS